MAQVPCSKPPGRADSGILTAMPARPACRMRALIRIRLTFRLTTSSPKSSPASVRTVSAYLHERNSDVQILRSGARTAHSWHGRYAVRGWRTEYRAARPFHNPAFLWRHSPDSASRPLNPEPTLGLHSCSDTNIVRAISCLQKAPLSETVQPIRLVYGCPNSGIDPEPTLRYRSDWDWL
jgi:hypothetical protein